MFHGSNLFIEIIFESVAVYGLDLHLMLIKLLGSVRLFQFNNNQKIIYTILFHSQLIRWFLNWSLQIQPGNARGNQAAVNLSEQSYFAHHKEFYHCTDCPFDKGLLDTSKYYITAKTEKRILNDIGYPK